MALNHGVNTYKDETPFAAVRVTGTGIPFFVGAAPVHTAGGYTGLPQLFTSYAEAVTGIGYSDEWRETSGAPRWSLCQAMYSHLRLYGMQPAIFMNVFDPETHKEAVAAADKTVTDHEAQLPNAALIDAGLIVKDGDATNTLVKDTDYTAAYDGDYLVIALKAASTYYAETKLNIAYNAADPTAITAADIEEGLDAIDQCKTLLNVVPDLICIPGWSSNVTVAALMATKAAAICTVYKGKAVVDVPTDASTGADSYDEVYAWMTANNYVDENMIVCWPLVKNGDLVFDLSVQLCGLMAQVDQENGGCPYESPSNKDLKITGACVAAGTEVNLTLTQADVVSVTAGAVTALNYGGWVAWGNYTGAYAGGSTDVAEYFICTNRVQDWICNVFQESYWDKVDKPMTKAQIYSIINAFNVWLAGLTGEGKLYGGEIVYDESNNTLTALVAGQIRFDTAAASPMPMQRIDMHTVFDVDLITAALS